MTEFWKKVLDETINEKFIFQTSPGKGIRKLHAAHSRPHGSP